MRTSYSSLLRSMPVYQPQLNITPLRSFAPAAAVYGGAAPPRPPRPCPAGCPAACPPAAGAAPRSWAPARDGTPIMRAATIATRVHIVLFREAILISRYRSVVRIARGDSHDGAIRPRNRLEESQGIPVNRR